VLVLVLVLGSRQQTAPAPRIEQAGAAGANQYAR